MSFFSRWRNRRRNKRRSRNFTPAPNQSKPKEFAGPVRPGRDEQKFRRTGDSTPTPKKTNNPSRRSHGSGGGSSRNFTPAPNQSKPKEFAGPVQPGFNEQQFRKTGNEGRRLRGESVIKKTNIPTQIQAGGNVGRSQLQKQNLKQASSGFIPRFFTTGTVGKIDTAYITKGEVQTQRELKRFNIQQKYQSDIQSQFNKSGLSVEDFKASDQYKTTTKKTQTQLDSIKNVPGFYDLPDLRTPGQVFKDNIPIYSSGKILLASAKETSSAVQTQSQAEKIIGTGNVSQKTALTSIGKTALAGGIFAFDVGMGVGIAKAGINIGRNIVEKDLTSGISKSIESLGKSKIYFGDVTDISSGQFKQGFSQEFAGFSRRGTINGFKNNLGEGLGTGIGKGNSIFGGTYKLKGGKKILAKVVGSDTQRTIIGGESFDISGIGLTSEGGKVAGLTTSRSSGIGSFTPTKSTFAIIKPGQSFKVETFGFLDKPGQFQKNLIGEGRTITTQFKTPSFTAELPKGKLTFSGDIKSSGFSYETNLNQYKPVQEKITIEGVKKSGSNKPMFDLNKKFKSGSGNSFRIETPKITTPSRNGLVLEQPKTININEVRTKLGTRKTLQKGFSETSITTTKPFSLRGTQSFYGIGLRTGSKLAGSTGLKQLFKTSKIFNNKQSTKNSFIKLQQPSLISSTGTGQITDTTLNTGTISGRINSGITSPTITQPISSTPIPRLPFIPLPRLSPQIGKSKKVGMAGFGSRFFKYTPSFAALKFNITSTKKSKGIIIGGREVYSGLRARAIIKSKSKKKKKKSKK